MSEKEEEEILHLILIPLGGGIELNQSRAGLRGSFERAKNKRGTQSDFH